MSYVCVCVFVVSKLCCANFFGFAAFRFSSNSVTVAVCSTHCGFVNAGESFVKANMGETTNLHSFVLLFCVKKIRFKWVHRCVNILFLLICHRLQEMDRGKLIFFFSLFNCLPTTELFGCVFLKNLHQISSSSYSFLHTRVRENKRNARKISKVCLPSKNMSCYVSKMKIKT